MNRIPTEGLKHEGIFRTDDNWECLNEQNPDRGIETILDSVHILGQIRLNEQNPDRGIETTKKVLAIEPGLCLNEQNPDRGIETFAVFGAVFVLIMLE